MDATDLKQYFYSRFSQTERVLYDNQDTFGRWKSPITDLLVSSATAYVVSSSFAGRPDLIAYSLYGNSSLDWLIIAMNNASDALNWPKVGDTIVVPSRSLIASELV
jgi:hypothetical protein